MIVTLRVAVVDEREPEFERIDLRAWRAALNQLRKRVGE